MKGEEERLKFWRSILLNALMLLLVIFLFCAAYFFFTLCAFMLSGFPPIGID